jgi:phage-related protein
MQEGIEEIKELYIKHIHDKLWEIRGKTGRAIYVTITGNIVVILRCFTKKTNQTPKPEIELALRRMKELDTYE